MFVRLVTQENLSISYHKIQLATCTISLITNTVLDNCARSSRRQKVPANGKKKFEILRKVERKRCRENNFEINRLNFHVISFVPSTAPLSNWQRDFVSQNHRRRADCVTRTIIRRYLHVVAERSRMRDAFCMHNERPRYPRC